MSRVEREDYAWRLLCLRLGRDPMTSEETDTCTLRAAWRAMLAMSSIEHARAILNDAGEPA